MKRFGKPTLLVHVYGDWGTIIGVDAYRDELLKQKPHDEDFAEYGSYRVVCADTGAMVKAYNEFTGRGLQCFFGMEFASEDKAVRASMDSGNGYGNDSPHCDVEANTPTSPIEAAAKQAIEILKQAVK